MSQFNDLLMPKLGLTMTEGMLMEWAVAPGDAVRAGDLLFVVETEKVANEVAAEADGVMGEIVVQTGETVPVGAVVGRWTGPGQAGSATQPEQEQAASVPQGHTLQDARSLVPPRQEAVAHPATEDGAPSSTQQTAAADDASSRGAGRVIATPLARRLAREEGMDLAQIRGSGPGGRIKAVDVRQAAGQQAPVAASAPAAAMQPAPQTPAGTTQVPPSALVQSMARRMTQAKQVPHFYLSAEAEISELLSLRRRLNAMEGLNKLTLNHFVIAAVARALEMVPEQNRIWQDDHIIHFDGIDVGMAVSTERGLLAPVLHGLRGASLDDIALQSRDLIARVKEGRASRDDMAGGSITVSNGGMFNVTYMTPIINPPQSAILGVGSIRDVFRPDAQGAPALRREMGLVLAADHRLHDGASALKFLNQVIDLLQDPYRLMRNRTQNQG